MKCALCEKEIKIEEGYHVCNFTCDNPPEPWNVCEECYNKLDKEARE